MGAADLPDHQITMCPSSGLGTKPIVGFFLHFGQLVSTCVPFSLGASEDTLKRDVINWCMFIWCVCFTMTLSIFTGEFCGLRSRLPFSWDAFLRAHAFYFSIPCFSLTIIFGATYIKFLPPGSAQNRVITATAFAFVAAVLYDIEVFCIISSLEARSGSSQPSQACSGGQRTMLTGSSSRSSAAPTSVCISQPMFVVVYFICFLLEGAVNFIVKGFDRVKDKKLCSLPVSCLN